VIGERHLTLRTANKLLVYFNLGIGKAKVKTDRHEKRKRPHTFAKTGAFSISGKASFVLIGLFSMKLSINPDAMD
jgi:hypothetical protein